MKILHSSDLHGKIQRLFDFNDFDLWIDTGDFFPNTSIKSHIEIPFQKQWLTSYKDDIKSWLGNKPFLSVGGNHDYIDLADNLGFGVDIIKEVKAYVNGISFAGFPEVPYIGVGWNRETQDQELLKIVNQTFEHNASILLVHSPPYGILDYCGEHVGNKSLINKLLYATHNITLVLCGHIHEARGQYQMHNTLIVNSAIYPTIVEIQNNIL